jgi:MOSC domain-containing protein YiiM
MNPHKRGEALTGIEKVPTSEPVLVRAPGTKRDGLGGGLVGDMVCDRQNHGGDTQAVYAYAREDLDHWQSVLGRTLPGGVFGENLTTTGVDVNGAVIGERWRIGDELELAVTVPRIPCGTFRGWIAERGWLRTFARAAMPGTYLSVVKPGRVCAGDPVSVLHRPAHGVTVSQVFRAVTLEPDLLPLILAADQLEEETKEMARAGRTFELD